MVDHVLHIELLRLSKTNSFCPQEILKLWCRQNPSGCLLSSSTLQKTKNTSQWDRVLPNVQPRSLWTLQGLLPPFHQPEGGKSQVLRTFQPDLFLSDTDGGLRAPGTRCGTKICRSGTLVTWTQTFTMKQELTLTGLKH